jgi:hypothetical protein
MARLARLGGRHPVSLGEILVLLGFSLAGLLIVSLLDSRHAPPPPPTAKIVRYGFTVQNTLGRPVEEAGVFIPAPVPESATQRLMRLRVDHPHDLIRDDAGNQVVYLPLGRLAPYASRVVQLGAELELRRQPMPVRLVNSKRWLKPEKFIESDHPGVRQTAAGLRTVERIFEWVSRTVQKTGMSGPERGALHALLTRSGDCTEMADLFVALCRAGGIPARTVGGFLSPESAVLKAHAFHNWAEFYQDGTWHLADPQRRVIRERYGDYVAVQIMTEDPAAPLGRGLRLALQGEGLTGRMD